MNSNSILKEICEKSGRILERHGYTPDYDEEGEFLFCEVGGVTFSFHPIDEDIFLYSAEFELATEPTPEEQEQITDLFMSIDEDDVAFENLHIDGNVVVLSSAFYFDMYEEEMIELAVKTLEATDGIASELKARM